MDMYLWFIQPETVAFQFTAGLGSPSHLCGMADVCTLAHFRNEPTNFPVRLHCYFSLEVHF